MNGVDLQVQVRQLGVAEHLEKSVEDPASASQEEVHTVLIAEAAEVAGTLTDLEGTQTDREEAHQVQSQMEQMVVPFVDVHMDQQEEEGSVLERAHEAVERRID